MYLPLIITDPFSILPPPLPVRPICSTCKIEVDIPCSNPTKCFIYNDEPMFADDEDCCDAE